MEEFFNSLKEIVQRSESKRSKNALHMQPEQRPVDRHAQVRAQQQFGRPTGRLKEGSADRQSDLLILLGVELRF